jgi:hypothetical protein
MIEDTVVKMQDIPDTAPEFRRHTIGLQVCQRRKRSKIIVNFNYIKHKKMYKSYSSTKKQPQRSSSRIKKQQQF